MSKITHVFVTVPEGREVPIPANEAAGAGGSLLRLVAGKVYKLPWSSYTRRRIPSGDLILSNQEGTKVTSAELARADAKIKVDADGAVDKDQRTDDEINKAAEAEAAGEEARRRKLGAGDDLLEAPNMATHSRDATSSSSPKAGKFDTSDAKGKA